MSLLVTSFIAGFLTILAPCILPLLPVTLGGSMAEAGNRRRPMIIIASLAVSVFVFTLLLKGSTAFITVSPSFWTYMSAVILGLFGLTLLFPITWAKLVLKLPGHDRPDSWLATGYQHRGQWWADVLVGAALGPVFTTCSPTFFVILATVLPQSLSMGIIDLLAYVVGLAIALLLVAHVGQRLVNRLEWATNPNGWFKKTLGVLFVVIAVLIALGLDKQIEANILSSGFFDVTKWEQSIREALDSTATPATSSPSLLPSGENVATSTVSGKLNRGNYVEIVNPAGFVNSEPFKLVDIVGKKVILIDFIDYSCINCQRTYPYLNSWYKTYKDQGLEIVAIHTPEFAFERDIKNVTAAAKAAHLEFPIVLDNDYSTWNAYRNSFWPHKYLIDIHGNVVYDHIGEGSYEETASKIMEQLQIRKEYLRETGGVVKSSPEIKPTVIAAESPETYFGGWRNENFGNGQPGRLGDRDFTLLPTLQPDFFYLAGKWRVEKEYIEALSENADISYAFTATNMYMVALSADGSPIEAKITVDGKLVETISIDTPRLYQLYSGKSIGKHRIDIMFSKPGVRAYTFTFG